MIFGKLEAFCNKYIENLNPYATKQIVKLILSSMKE
jgi:hypothetical protein